jgi:hypothetical protein
MMMFYEKILHLMYRYVYVLNWDKAYIYRHKLLYMMFYGFLLRYTYVIVFHLRFSGPKCMGVGCS